MRLTSARRRSRDEAPLTSREDLEHAGRALTLRLKRSYGNWLLLFLGAQLTAANGFMLAYASWGYEWAVPDVVMKTWLAATVVELIGVVYVVVAHLFPRGGPH